MVVLERRREALISTVQGREVRGADARWREGGSPEIFSFTP
jgi:hypothetical protein